MITQKQKSKKMVIRMLLTLPVFALLILLNTQCENVKVNDKQTVNADNVINEVNRSNPTSVQNADVEVSKDSIYTVTEEMPQFPGGPNELMKYLGENIKYPQSAIDNKIEGRVFVSFVIEKDGYVTNAEVLRGIDKDCEAEALRVVSSMPKWSPGLNEDGDPVRCKFTVPVVFKLNNKE